MKRKFYLLALACAVVGTSVISSCKDTDEDLYNDLKNQLALTDSYYKQLENKLVELENKLAEKMKEQGPKGDKGDKGDTGAAGANGTNGADGKSAYDIAKDNGFTGTEAEWLLSLKGEKGDPGQDAAIDEALKAVEALREEHNKDINELKELINNLEAALTSLDVAGVIIQNIYNPAFGYLSLPLDIQSNVLMSYYSTVTSSDWFPVPAGSDDNGLTDEEFAALSINKASRFDLTDNTIKVGKVYLTVNPTNINFSGKTPLLVNSKGEESGISLSALEACDEELMFGYTRAASTGLYVSEATVSDLGAAEKIDLNVQEKAEEILEATKGPGNNASKIVRVVYETLNNVCARKAIQLSSDKNNTVVSEYGIAAAIIKPMGFQTLDKLCGSTPMDKLKELFSIKTSSKTVNGVLAAIESGLDQLSDRALPAIIAKDATDAKLVSIDSKKPTSVDGTLELHAVSLCAETLVPYVMKHVAVTKVVNADGTLNPAAAKEANQAVNMDCVLTGDFKVNLAGLVSGATYEVAYSVMDYAGDTKILRYYFTVK